MDLAQQKFTHSTALIIHSWSALDMAVQMELAGPESSNIRDWLGGVIVDMFSFPVEGGTGTGEKIPDRDDLEDVLLQVLEDEFELRLEDDSAYQVAGDIVKSYELCLQGDFKHVDNLERMYEALKRRPKQQPKIEVEGEEDDSGEEMEDGQEEISTGGDGGEGQGMDVDNGPVIDEDGFQLVQGKGKRRGK